MERGIKVLAVLLKLIRLLFLQKKSVLFLFSNVEHQGNKFQLMVEDPFFCFELTAIFIMNA